MRALLLIILITLPFQIKKCNTILPQTSKVTTMKKSRDRKKKCSKSFPIKITIGNIYLSFCVCVWIYVLSTPVLTAFLKHYGKRCKAVITENETSWRHRYTTNNYQYEFIVRDKTYTGNSLIEVGNEERIGDSIEVLYFKHAPFFNRPTSFYEDE